MAGGYYRIGDDNTNRSERVRAETTDVNYTCKTPFGDFIDTTEEKLKISKPILIDVKELPPFFVPADAWNGILYTGTVNDIEYNIGIGFSDSGAFIELGIIIPRSADNT